MWFNLEAFTIPLNAIVIVVLLARLMSLEMKFGISCGLLFVGLASGLARVGAGKSSHTPLKEKLLEAA